MGYSLHEDSLISICIQLYQTPSPLRVGSLVERGLKKFKVAEYELGQNIY